MIKRCILGIIFISSFIFETYSQEKKMSSRGTEDYLNEYLDSASYFLNTNPSKSFDYIEKTLALSTKTGNKYGEASAYQSLGRVNYNLNQFDLAIDYYRKAIVLFESLNQKKELIGTYEKMGDALTKSDNNKEAISYYQKCIKYYDSNNLIDEAARVKKSLADVYIKTGETNKALGLLNELLLNEKKRNNTSGIIETQNNIAQIYQQTNKENDAIRFYSNSAAMAQQFNNEEALKSSLRGKGSALRQEKRYDEELEIRQQLIDLSDKKNDKLEIAEENLQIGNLYLEQNKAEKAIPYFQKSIKLSDETKNLEGKVKAQKVLSTAYGQQQSFDKALETYTDYVETMDAIYKKREADIMASVQLTTTLNRKLERLDLIEKDLDVSRKTVDLLHQEHLVNIREMRAQRVLTYSLSGALIILAFASIFILRSSNLKRKSNQLLALRSLRSQMNPHFIYNSLNSVNSYISKNDEKAANKYLSDFSNLMRSVMENSKYDFVPLTAEIETLKLYLALEHSRFSDKFDYTFIVDESMETEGISIPPMLIQPFIENAIWHGLRYMEDKGELNVEVSKISDILQIIVEDNGIGRKKSKELKTKFQKEHASTGLMNIENRVQLINHLFNTRIEIKIEDLEGQNIHGTKICLKIPVNARLG